MLLQEPRGECEHVATADPPVRKQQRDQLGLRKSASAPSVSRRSRGPSPEVSTPSRVRGTAPRLPRVGELMAISRGTAGSGAECVASRARAAPAVAPPQLAASAAPSPGESRLGPFPVQRGCAAPRCGARAVRGCAPRLADSARKPFADAAWLRRRSQLDRDARPERRAVFHADHATGRHFTESAQRRTHVGIREVAARRERARELLGIELAAQRVVETRRAAGDVAAADAAEGAARTIYVAAAADVDRVAVEPAHGVLRLARAASRGSSGRGPARASLAASGPRRADSTRRSPPTDSSCRRTTAATRPSQRRLREHHGEAVGALLHANLRRNPGEEGESLASGEVGVSDSRERVPQRLQLDQDLVLIARARARARSRSDSRRARRGS